MTTALQATRPDTAVLVEDALKATAAYGIESAEARVAWDIVEEADASDNSVATLPSMDEECSVEEQEAIDAKCEEYGRFLDELNSIRSSMSVLDDKNNKLSMVETLKNIKLKEPEASKVISSPELTEALEDARTATSKFGATSPEAALAWEAYEEIASSGLQNSMGVRLDEECDIESGQDICEAMDELQRVLPVMMAVASKN